MEGDKVEKGCFWFASNVISFLLGAAIGGFAGMFFGKNLAIAIVLGVFGGGITNRIFMVWWKSMVKAQKNPILAVFLFLLIFVGLAIGIIFFALSSK